MKFKGLINFFSIALIIISVYQLHFTLVVKLFEKKIERGVSARVKKLSAGLSAPYQKDSLYKAVYKSVLDSSYKKTVTYGINGAINYKTAKEQELNLGLDLQGGMNVTLDIKINELIQSLSNNSKDFSLNEVLDKVESRRGGSGKNYIDLFYEVFKELNPNKNLSLYFLSNKNKIRKESSDKVVLEYIKEEISSAVKRTFDILQTRIDQFGVSQPSINLDADKGIISVELPGNQEDPDRIRKYLQATANLQFWEIHSVEDLAPSFVKAAKAVDELVKIKKEKQYIVKKNSVPNLNVKKGEKKSKSSEVSIVDAFDNVVKEDSTKNSEDKDLNILILISKQIEYVAQQASNKKIPLNKVPFMFQIEDRHKESLEQILKYEAVVNILPPNVKFLYGIKKDNGGKEDNPMTTVYAIKTEEGSEFAKLEGDNIEDAHQDYDDRGAPAIRVVMSKSGEKIWEEMTGSNIQMPIAISLDNLVYSAPVVNGVISGGVSQISGNFSIQESQDLANILKSGKLPVQAKIVQEQIVGPTLGEEAIKGGLYSFLISFLLISALMWLYYSSGGTVANVSLILNLLFTVGILSALGASLTAPGIAGLVLTIGMAVDTNVIIFERIREDIVKGSTYVNAIINGYKRSLAPVLDSHITTLLTAIILFKFGLGPIKGFATTQILGILLSLLCGILISRQISEWWTNRNRNFNYFTTFSKRIFKRSKFEFIKFRKYAYLLSVVVLFFGLFSFYNGFDQGVEFKGGRSYTVRFEKAVNMETLRGSLQEKFNNESPIIKTIGDAKQLNITTSYLIDKNGKEVDIKVERMLFEGLRKFLPLNTDFDAFVKKHKVASMKVLPTISEDLKRGAIKATIFALVLIFLYILFRFRKWQFSLGTIIALIHDVLVMLIVFSFARKFVSFPLEIDQHFIAAILTVIGFSMNDTVIVFDRIREYLRIMPNSTKTEVIDKAINDTLSRTIMTSATVFITVLVLFIFGGDVTKGFAFAMMLGIITGTYSSIFVAAPVLIDLDKTGVKRTQK